MIINKMHFKNKKMIIHFLFNTQHEMNRTFLRLSEYLESPTFKGTFFTHEEFLETNNYYYDEVIGHNISGNKLMEFLGVYKDRLTKEEASIIDTLFSSMIFKTLNNVYVIATFKGSNESGTLYHEIAHALYYFYPKYRRISSNVIKYYEFYFKPMEAILEYLKYDESVWVDEKISYLIDLGLGYINPEMAGHKGKGFFYGDNWSGFLKRLLFGKIVLHFRYKYLSKILARKFLTVFNEKLLVTRLNFEGDKDEDNKKMV